MLHTYAKYYLTRHKYQIHRAMVRTTALWPTQPRLRGP